MKKTILLNGVMNISFCFVFVLLNNLALQNNLEETFVSLALLYGIVATVGNMLYIAVFCKK